jgi:hypothetical protein
VLLLLCCRLVLERGYRKKDGMTGRHIAIGTWLEALGLQAYLPVFSKYAGVEVCIGKKNE